MTTTEVILRILNTLLMVGIPCLLAVILIRRGNDGFRPIGIGVAAFVFSQAGHIPFNQFVLLPALEGGGIGLSQSGWKLLVMGIAVGFSAGIFEETARYLSFRFWLNKEPSTLLPIKYGVGHGGIEAFLLGILTLYALIQVLTLGGEGSLDSFSSEQADLIRAQIFAYWDVPWQHLLLGAWERVSAMIFHIGASLMVYKSVRKKKPSWLAIAVLGHTLLNAFAVVSSQKMDFVLVESILFIFSLGWLFWAWTLREREVEELMPELPLPGETRLQTQRITAEQLEASRYDE